MKKGNYFLFFSLFVLSVFLAGCGYTRQTHLPEYVRTIHVKPVKNAIDLSQEITDKSRFTTYRPGLEVELTNAIIDRFIFDGHLQVVEENKADVVIQSSLIAYRRDALRFAGEDDPIEFRLSVIADVTAKDVHSQKSLWERANLVGDATYYLSGPLARSEDEAVSEAVEDLARRVVEETLEVW